jgi:RNA polymerase sigma-54 factor
MDFRQFLKLVPERRMTMTWALRQALEMLQMSQIELSQWLEQEIEKNPLLEVSSISGKKSFVGDIAILPNLHEHLFSQIREHFLSEEERVVAGKFVECLDEKGFISVPPEQVDDQFIELAPKVLSVLQTFDPPGIFARTLAESFLIQLSAKEKEHTDAFRIVKECFDDLLHGRYKTIEKKLGVLDLSAALKDLSMLSMRPAGAFRHEPTVTVFPDLKVEKVDGGWTLEVVEDDLPIFHIRSEYADLNPESQEEKEALRGFKTQAKWIFRSLSRRKKMLKDIGKELVAQQSLFLSQKGPLVSFSVKDLSEKLQIHESTLSRVLYGKYISTPLGVLPLRSLITRAILEKLIRCEDKKAPLTDDQLAKALKDQGFSVARRTIAKYRAQLKIGSAKKRKRSG